MSFWVKIGK